jgi:hypothetical protein
MFVEGVGYTEDTLLDRGRVLGTGDVGYPGTADVHQVVDDGHGTSKVVDKVHDISRVARGAVDVDAGDLG